MAKLYKESEDAYWFKKNNGERIKINVREKTAYVFDGKKKLRNAKVYTDQDGNLWIADGDERYKLDLKNEYVYDFSSGEKIAVEFGKEIAKQVFKSFFNNKKKSSDGCYITTATFKALKTQNDKCEELELFRWYRDNILAKEADGKKLIEEYYQTAPLIVEKINSQPNAEEIYHNLWENYLKPCLEHLKRGEYQKVKTLYVQMVRNLQKEFLNQKENTI